VKIARIIAGLVIAPLVPGALIAVALIAVNEGDEATAAFLASIDFGVPIALLFGAPIHFALLRSGSTSIFVYLASGAAIGGLLYVLLPPFIDLLMRLQGFEAGGHTSFSIELLPVLAVCTTIAAMTFWLIARPDRAALR
jgi:hypothetical protein